MINDYTLIACVGTGQYMPAENGEGRYRKTIYQFNDGYRSEEVNLFLTAIIKSKVWNLKKIILVGTHTSSWDAIVPDKLGKNSKLWDDLCIECEREHNGQGIKEENIHLLEGVLKEFYDIEFKILAHETEIINEHLDSILSVYNEVFSHILPKTKLVIDVTHGFRIMPMLLYQSLQLHSDEINSSDVEIIYGEYNEKDKVSYVRYVSLLWQIAEIERELVAFKTALNGNKLAEYVIPYSSNLAIWIKDFTELIQKNFVLRINPTIANLKLVLKDLDTQEKYPEWIKELKSFLNIICVRCSASLLSDQLFKFSEFLFEHNLETQATIALWESVRVACVQRTSKDEKQDIGKYDYFQNDIDCVKSRMEDLAKRLNIAKELFGLRNYRNQIAHAGMEDYMRPYDSRKEISNYPKYRKAIEIFLKNVDLL